MEMIYYAAYDLKTAISYLDSAILISDKEKNYV